MAHFFDGLVFYHIGELKEVVQSSVSIRASTGLSNRNVQPGAGEEKNGGQGTVFSFWQQQTIRSVHPECKTKCRSSGSSASYSFEIGTRCTCKHL